MSPRGREAPAPPGRPAAHRAAVPAGLLHEVARHVGTPTYVYDARALDAGVRRWIRAAGDPGRVWYSVKANSNREILRRLARHGVHFEVATEGEYARVRAAGIPAARVLFGGVPKGAETVRLALREGADLVVLQADHEVEAAATYGEAKRSAGSASSAGSGGSAGSGPVGLRVRPGIRAGGHPALETAGADAKFGFRPEEVPAAWARLADAPGVGPRALAIHLGSAVESPEPYARAMDVLLDLAERLERVGPPVRELDLGGGVSIDYRDGSDPDPARVVGPLLARAEARGLALRFEPGRSVVAGMGLLLTRVLYGYRTADGAALVCDAAFSDFSRFVLYGAYHRIESLDGAAGGEPSVDVLGATCESGDVIGRARPLHGVEAGDLLVVRDVGAYGFTMASNYNSRRRPAEVLVEGDVWSIVRRRESLRDLWRGEEGVTVGDGPRGPAAQK